MQTACRARILALAKVGIKIEAKIPTMAMATNISVRVYPLLAKDCFPVKLGLFIAFMTTSFAYTSREQAFFLQLRLKKIWISLCVPSFNIGFKYELSTPLERSSQTKSRHAGLH